MILHWKRDLLLNIYDLLIPVAYWFRVGTPDVGHSEVFNMWVVNRLVIADELDYLITKDRVVLHDLFMLTTLPSSRIILIGMT